MPIKAAPHVTTLELVNRLVPNAMEPRAVHYL
jgi:hypothetical protein